MPLAAAAQAQLEVPWESGTPSPVGHFHWVDDLSAPSFCMGTSGGGIPRLPPPSYPNQGTLREQEIKS